MSIFKIWKILCENHKESVSNFYQIYDFKIIINDPTCHKNSENRTFVDLIMTNKPKCFQYSITIETELSVFWKAGKCNIRRKDNSDFSIVTIGRVSIIFLELGVAKNFMQNF